MLPIVKSLKAEMGKANDELSPSGTNRLSTLLQVKEEGRCNRVLGLSALLALGLDSGEPQRKGKLLGKEFSIETGAFSFPSRFTCFWDTWSLQSLAPLERHYVERQTLSTFKPVMILLLCLFRPGIWLLVLLFALTCVPSSADLQADRTAVSWDHHVYSSKPMRTWEYS